MPLCASHRIEVGVKEYLLVEDREIEQARQAGPERKLSSFVELTCRFRSIADSHSGASRTAFR
jgi:hypothetical protein